MFTTLRRFIFAHKIITLVVVVVLVGGGYYWYVGSQGAATVTKYVIQDATRGTVVASVMGSGQVNPVTQIDVQPQVSEMVTNVYVQPGDVVHTGDVLVQLDTTNEQKALTQAELSLQSAQLALAKLQEVTTSTLLQDQDAVTRGAQTLSNDYQNGFDTLSSALVDFQNVMAGLQDFATGYDISKIQGNPDAYVSLMPSYLQGSTLPYRDTVDADYTIALAEYQQNLADYHSTDRNAPTATLDALFSETYKTAEEISATIKASKDLLNYVTSNYPKNAGVALPAITTTYQTNMGTYTNTIDGDVSNLSGVITGITSDELSLNEASVTLATLVAGPDPLDVQSQQISIQSAQLALQTAQQNLADCSIRSPIDGVVSAVDAIVGENVPSPAVSIVGTGNEADITLNEVDAAKVVVGDPTTLTFDALPNVSLAGKVTELDPVGTVSQGVVNYTVKIVFTQPANTSSSNEVKPGMSVTSAIVTQADQNVIAVPNSAITTSGGTSYILEPSTPVSTSTLVTSALGGVELASAPKRVPVTIGLANNTMTEITSGVNVGDQIITQTITTTAAASVGSPSAGASPIRLGGGAFFGGGRGGGG